VSDPVLLVSRKRFREGHSDSRHLAVYVR